MVKVDVFELNGKQQSALIEKAPKEVLNELSLAQSSLIKIISGAETSTFEYKELIILDLSAGVASLRLELIQERKSKITTKYISSIRIPMGLALYVIEV